VGQEYWKPLGNSPDARVAANPNSMASQLGFSLVQLLLAVTILGVIGGFAISKWNQFHRKQTLVGEAKALLVFLEEARSFGQKKNKQVGIRFDSSGTAYRLFEDKNGNGSMDNGEAVRNIKLPANVAFGLPESPPSSGPLGQTLATHGLSGAWNGAWIASLDLSTTPSIGEACLKQNQLKAFTVCLYGQATTQKISASLWNGTTWITL
jgi:type II secretory pathway pseudopilin PulG